MTWHIIQCPSGKERETEAILARLGYEDTFYPKRTVDARPRGKALRGKHAGPNTVQRAWVTGYVFVDPETGGEKFIQTKPRLHEVEVDALPHIGTESLAKIRDRGTHADWRDRATYQVYTKEEIPWLR